MQEVATFTDIFLKNYFTNLWAQNPSVDLVSATTVLSTFDVDEFTTVVVRQGTSNVEIGYTSTFEYTGNATQVPSAEVHIDFICSELSTEQYRVNLVNTLPSGNQFKTTSDVECNLPTPPPTSAPTEVNPFFRFCNILCSQTPGARKDPVNVNGLAFQAAVSQYIADPSSSPYGTQINCWDVSRVTDMSFAFSSQPSFNSPIQCWNVSNVRTMENLFDGAINFNQPLENWQVGNVERTTEMFENAARFNQSLANWDVSKVVDMTYMFSGAESFNQPLASWKVSNAAFLTGMFRAATSFNQPLAAWNVSNAQDISSMFLGAFSFDQNLCPWSVSVRRGTNVEGMFLGTRCPDTSTPVPGAIPPSSWCQSCSGP
jgi:hypothetical protein